MEECHASIPSKEELRTVMRRKRVALAASERERVSRGACKALMRSPEWGKATVVALYMAVRGEIDCGLLLRDAWEKGKKALLPLCSAAVPGEMRMVACSGPDRLRPGAFGIPEPVAEEAPTEPESAPDIILVPGLAFDRQGNRLGMGGGYYDRLLARPVYAASLVVGFAYAFQIVDHLPAGKHDVPVGALCTDTSFMRIR